MNIPNEEDWLSGSQCLELKSARKIFFGKSNLEVQSDFYNCVIERVQELKSMPTAVFQYYMYGFNKFIEEDDFEMFSEADAASCFLNLVDYKLAHTPEDIMPLMSELIITAKHIATNQERYEAPKNIYGDFNEQYSNICKNYSNRLKNTKKTNN